MKLDFLKSILKPGAFKAIEYIIAGAGISALGYMGLNRIEKIIDTKLSKVESVLLKNDSINSAKTNKILVKFVDKLEDHDTMIYNFKEVNKENRELRKTIFNLWNENLNLQSEKKNYSYVK